MKGAAGKVFRDFLEQNPAKLVSAVIGCVQNQGGTQSISTKNDMRYPAIRIINLLVSTGFHISYYRAAWVGGVLRVRTPGARPSSRSIALAAVWHKILPIF